MGTPVRSIEHSSRVALVTGGASGIGEAIARQLASEGHTVAISDLNQEAGKAVADAIGGLFIEADLHSPEACRLCVDTVIQKTGRLDILINNAGLQHVSPLEDFPEEKWESMIQLMLISPFRLIKHAWPYLKASAAGRVVNMGSIHSVIASENKSAYVSAKHGLLGLTRSAALEGGGHAITVNAVCPAYVRTPLVDRQIQSQAKALSLSPDQVEQEVFLKSAAVKRLIEPEEVAHLVAYLCSERAGAVTGATLSMDLGWTAQ